MLRACAALANAPACAERMAVRPRPRMDTATSTSRSVKPSARGKPLCVISKPRVQAVRGLDVVAWPRHADPTLLDVGLARERRDHDADDVGGERRPADA